MRQKVQLTFHHLECNFASKSPAGISSFGVQFREQTTSFHFIILSAMSRLKSAAAISSSEVQFLEEKSSWHFIIWSSFLRPKVQLTFHHLECHFATKTPAGISSSGVQFREQKSRSHFIIWSAFLRPKHQLPLHHLEYNFASKSPAPTSSSGVQIESREMNNTNAVGERGTCWMSAGVCSLGCHWFLRFVFLARERKWSNNCVGRLQLQLPLAINHWRFQPLNRWVKKEVEINDGG